MHLVVVPLAAADPALPEVRIPVDRVTLAKPAWRARAEDGAEFRFELRTTLQTGDAVFQSPTARYVICQTEEPVVEIPLDLPASAAAGIGWAIGNLHVELSGDTSRLLAADGPAIRQLLERLKVSFRPTTAVFRPGRFSRGPLPVQDVGRGHKH